MRSAVVGTNYSSRLRAHSYAHARRRASRSLPELRLQNHSQPQHPAPRQPPPRQSASPQPGKISSKALVLLLPPVLLSPLAQLRAPPFAAIAPPSPAKPPAPGCGCGEMLTLLVLGFLGAFPFLLRSRHFTAMEGQAADPRGRSGMDGTWCGGVGGGAGAAPSAPRRCDPEPRRSPSRARPAGPARCRCN